MQQMLQELFERECQNYSFYLQSLKIVSQQYDEMEKRKEEIIQEGKTEKRVKEVAELLKSEEFKNVKGRMGLPENFAEVEKSFSEYKPDKGSTKRIAILSEQERILALFLEKLRENLKNSQVSIFYYIEIATKNKIKFIFPKDNQIARKIFVLYYADGFHFSRNRNVIEVNGCKLSKTFMKAYMAKTEEEQIKAIKWFEKNSKKYQEF